jgi:hypothetical protein
VEVNDAAEAEARQCIAHRSLTLQTPSATYGVLYPTMADFRKSTAFFLRLSRIGGMTLTEYIQWADGEAPIVAASTATLPQ